MPATRLFRGGRQRREWLEEGLIQPAQTWASGGASRAWASNAAQPKIVLPAQQGFKPEATRQFRGGAQRRAWIAQGLIDPAQTWEPAQTWDLGGGAGQLHTSSQQRMPHTLWRGSAAAKAAAQLSGPMNPGNNLPPPRCLPDPPFFDQMCFQAKFDFCASAFDDLVATHDEESSGMTLAWVLKGMITEVDAVLTEVDTKKTFISKVGAHPWFKVNPFGIRIQPSNGRMYFSKKTRWNGPSQVPPGATAGHATLGQAALLAPSQLALQAPSQLAWPLAGTGAKTLQSGLAAAGGSLKRSTLPAAIVGGASTLPMPATKRPKLGPFAAPLSPFAAPVAVKAEGDEVPFPRQLPDASVFQDYSQQLLIEFCARTVEELLGSHDEASTGCPTAQMVKGLIDEVNEVFGADLESKKAFAQLVTVLPWFKESYKCVRVNANRDGRIYVSGRTRVVSNQGGRPQLVKPNLYGKSVVKGYARGYGKGYGKPSPKPPWAAASDLSWTLPGGGPASPMPPWGLRMADDEILAAANAILAARAAQS